MTSKISFHKMQKENFEHRPSVILITAFCFLLHVMIFVLRMQNVLVGEGISHREKLEQISRMAKSNKILILLAGMLGVLLAMNGFAYLHSKVKTDFYHSLPVKRLAIFGVIYLNSVLIFTVPMIVGFGLESVFVAVSGYGGAAFMTNMLYSVICYVLSFLLAFITAALAMLMTGHLAVGLLGFGVFAAYAPAVLRGIYPFYGEAFFDTYAGMGQDGAILKYFSPVSLALELIKEKESDIAVLDGKIVGITLFWIAALTLICAILFKKRKSEAAGKAMAFARTCPVIRILLVVPLSLYTGLFLYSTALSTSKVWMIIGILVGVWLFHGIIECIYQFDLRGLRSHPKQMMASLALAILIVLGFWFDISGYDRFIPEKADLASIFLSRTYTYQSDHSAEDLGWGKEPSGISGEKMEDVLELVRKMAENPVSDDDKQTDTFTVTYRMKNGREKARKYSFIIQDVEKELDKVYATKEYKADVYPLYTGDWSKIEGVEVYGQLNAYVEDGYVSLNKKEQEEFFRIYLEELTGLTYSYSNKNAPIAEFNFSIKGVSWGMESYYIYDNFDRTIAYLKEKGMDARKGIGDLTITKLEVTRYDEEKDEQTFTIADQEVIKKVKDHLMPDNYEGMAQGIDYDVDVTITVYVKGFYGTEKITAKTDRETAKLLVP